MIKILSFIFLIIFGVVLLVALFLMAKDDYKRRDVNLIDSLPVIIAFAVMGFLLPLLAFIAS